ncbi:threonine/serine ThrE exporter family protein [Aerococcus suis]|nr:threonine/serine exporter family protein [Aerococcus suis]
MLNYSSIGERCGELNQHKKMLETALLAGQIMTESNAESYRVEDTMNRILTSSNAAYAVAVSFSTSLYATLDDPSFIDGSFTGIKRINSKSTNLNKIALVNEVSRQLTSNKINIDQAYQQLLEIKQQKPQYNRLEQSFAIVGLAASFSVLFGGSLVDLIAATINGIILALLIRLTDRYYINSGISNVFQAFVVTLVSFLLHLFVIHSISTDIVTVSTLMPMVPGTAITNSLRDIFREDYIAGGARAMEAFLDALMIALGAAIALSLLRGTIL